MDTNLYKPKPRNAGTSDLPMFAEPAEAPAVRHSTTSVAAAEAIAPKLSETRRAVLRYICETVEHSSPDGLTDNQVITALVAKGWSLNTPRARRVELVDGGWLQENGTVDGSTRWRPTQQAWAWWLAHVHGEAA